MIMRETSRSNLCTLLDAIHLTCKQPIQLRSWIGRGLWVNSVFNHKLRSIYKSVTMSTDIKDSPSGAQIQVRSAKFPFYTPWDSNIWVLIPSLTRYYTDQSRHQQNPPQAHPNSLLLSMNSSTNYSTNSIMYQGICLGSVSCPYTRGI